jgi:hypothetical protein
VLRWLQLYWPVHQMPRRHQETRVHAIMNNITWILLALAALYAIGCVCYAQMPRWYRIWSVRRALRRSPDDQAMKRAAVRYEAESAIHGRRWE